ncbi:MAG: NUDIX hydrolase [Ferruginibacter sp.]|nr:NUDIX hydrolase [Ferruginibacter sp.]
MEKKSAKTTGAALLEQTYLPHISIDCVIFGYHEKQIKVLLSHVKGALGWLLPGGFIEMEQALDEAASKILEGRTGLTSLFLKQFKTFGSLNRGLDPATQFAGVPDFNPANLQWLSKRFLTIGYYALTEFSKVTPKPSLFDDKCQWFEINGLPPLLSDHELLIKEALRKLQLQLHHEPIGYNLLPEKFTLPEMQALYETILGKKLDQRNFTKKLVSLNLIKKLGEKKYIGGHRSPSLYKFNKRNYNKALLNGVILAF